MYVCMGGYACVHRVMPSWDCVTVLSVYYAIQMVDENAMTVVSSQFLNKGYHLAAPLSSVSLQVEKQG